MILPSIPALQICRAERSLSRFSRMVLPSIQQCHSCVVLAGACGYPDAQMPVLGSLCVGRYRLRSAQSFAHLSLPWSVQVAMRWFGLTADTWCAGQVGSPWVLACREAMRICGNAHGKCGCLRPRKSIGSKHTWIGHQPSSVVSLGDHGQEISGRMNSQDSVLLHMLRPPQMSTGCSECAATLAAPTDGWLLPYP